MLMSDRENMNYETNTGYVTIPNIFSIRGNAMCRISISCFTLIIFSIVALPLSAQLPPSPSLLSSHSSRACSSGIAEVDLIISDLADALRTGAASLKLDIARNMMDDGDYKGCARYVDSARRALTANE
jgi:hypothetical protein